MGYNSLGIYQDEDPEFGEKSTTEGDRRERKRVGIATFMNANSKNGGAQMPKFTSRPLTSRRNIPTYLMLLTKTCSFTPPCLHTTRNICGRSSILLLINLSIFPSLTMAFQMAPVCGLGGNASPSIWPTITISGSGLLLLMQYPVREPWSLGVVSDSRRAWILKSDI